MSAQPIVSFVAGLDEHPRNLSQEEIAKLSDWFGQWLARTPVADRALSLRSLLNNVIPRNSYRTFAIADGTPIRYNHERPDDPLNSVSRHLRFIIIALPDNNGNADLRQAIIQRTVCIVGSANPDGTGGGAFLQVASWDPNGLDATRGLGIMRFYGRLRDGWVFQGDSLNAFKSQSMDVGPFDGHIGGAMVMKELQAPWPHWFDGSNQNTFTTSLGSTRGNPSKCDPHNALYDELFSGTSGPAFSLVTRVEDLEPVVEASVSQWYRSRFTYDFLEGPSTHLRPLAHITAVKHWVGHILLSRSMNIRTSVTSTAQVQQQSDIGRVPSTLFFNSSALQSVLPDVGSTTPFNTIANQAYVESVNYLGLSLFYNDNSTVPPTRRLAVQGSEGPFSFPVIEPGVEDYEAVRQMVFMARRIPCILLPLKAISAMLMVDFFNPIYSARRESLMKYVPETATLKEDGRTYDVLDQMVAAINASPAAQDPRSPEYELLQLLATPDSTYISTFTRRVDTYLERVRARFTGVAADPQSAIQEYMALADSRRRIYRGRENEKDPGEYDGLGGLNEFLLTLPIATNELPLTCMLEDGTVTVMEQEHVAYFKKKMELKKLAMHKYAKTYGVCPVDRRIG